MGNNSYYCENTVDNVFLLSYRDMLNSSYVFSFTQYDDARKLLATPYAQCQGIYISDYAWWWLRSPHYTYMNGVSQVSGSGGVSTFNFVTSTGCGVVPALQIRL